MLRVANLFAAASAALLILGLLLSHSLKARQMMSLHWPGSNTTYLIGCHVPCYGFAGMFAIFACTYAMSWIRLNAAIVEWHMWLSVFGVVMFGVGFALLAHIATGGEIQQPSQRGLLAAGSGLVLGPATFAVGQVLFIVALIRAFAASRH